MALVNGLTPDHLQAPNEELALRVAQCWLYDALELIHKSGSHWDHVRAIKALIPIVADVEAKCEGTSDRRA